MFCAIAKQGRNVLHGGVSGKGRRGVPRPVLWYVRGNAIGLQSSDFTPKIGSGTAWEFDCRFGARTVFGGRWDSVRARQGLACLMIGEPWRASGEPCRAFGEPALTGEPGAHRPAFRAA
eukprot:gene14782-biopygen647